MAGKSNWRGEFDLGWLDILEDWIGQDGWRRTKWESLVGLQTILYNTLQLHHGLS